jgi:hypothetical protein
MGIERFSLFAVIHTVEGGRWGFGATSSGCSIFRSINKVLVPVVLGLDKHSLQAGCGREKLDL